MYVLAIGHDTRDAITMSWFTFVGGYEKAFVGTLGLGCIGLVGLIRFMLEQFREDTEIKPIQPKTQYITQDTEDSLKLDTLETLLGHYNYAIRETAAKIVCDRAVNDAATLESLLYGITRPEYDVRIRNLRCLAIITDTRELPSNQMTKSLGSWGWACFRICS
jgi:hypothetical protein